MIDTPHSTDRNSALYPPTLYEWVGGYEAVKSLFKRFYERVASDAILAPVFSQMSPSHFEIVACFVSEVLGGPKLYSGDNVHSHATMVAKHLGKHLSEEQRKQWMGLLLDTADEQGMPSDPEFRSALVGYLEWGSRIAAINSVLTSNPIDTKTPMPTWGWGEVKGPYIPT